MSLLKQLFDTGDALQKPHERKGEHQSKDIDHELRDKGQCVNHRTQAREFVNQVNKKRVHNIYSETIPRQKHDESMVLIGTTKQALEQQEDERRIESNEAVVVRIHP